MHALRSVATWTSTILFYVLLRSEKRKIQSLAKSTRKPRMKNVELFTRRQSNLKLWTWTMNMEERREYFQTTVIFRIIISTFQWNYNIAWKRNRTNKKASSTVLVSRNPKKCTHISSTYRRNYIKNDHRSIVSRCCVICWKMHRTTNILTTYSCLHTNEHM